MNEELSLRANFFFTITLALLLSCAAIEDSNRD